MSSSSCVPGSIWKWTGAAWLCVAETRTLFISPVTCMPTSASGFSAMGLCAAGARTEPGGNFACVLQATTSRETFLCPVSLPVGAVLEEIVVFGSDNDAGGYFEAVAWLSQPDGASVGGVATTGWTWQTSGIAFVGGQKSISPFPSSETPRHIDDTLPLLTVGIGLRSSGVGTIFVTSVRVRYRLP